MVYLAGSLALAALELLVHIDYEWALRDHVAIPADFDEQLLMSAELASLPQNWRAPTGLPYTQALGDAWIESRVSALLAVPSRVVPVERNYLLNPVHPDVAKIEIGDPLPFRFDSRLLAR